MTCGPVSIHVEGVAVPGSHDTTHINLTTGLTGNGSNVIAISNTTGQTCVIDTVTFDNTTSAAVTVSQVLVGSNPNITLLGTSMSMPATVNAGGSLSAYVQFCGNGQTNVTFGAPLYVVTNQSIQPQVYQIQAVQLPAAGVSTTVATAPMDFSIVPNPSSGPVTIQIDNSQTVKIEVFDILGNELVSLNGSTSISWSGRDQSGMQLPSGAYIVRVTGIDEQGKPFRASKEVVIQK